MFSDRSYARYDDYDKRSTSMLVWLLSSIIAGFVIQMIFGELLGNDSLKGIPIHAAAFSYDAVRAGYVWTFFSYAFLHSGPLHLLANVATIYFIGREVLPLLGSRRFVAVILAAAAGGAALWLAVNFLRPSAPLIGASAISLALLILFACFYPNNKITVLLFFIFPVTIRPKYMAAAAVALDLFGMIFYEILGAQNSFGIACSAHVGGMAVAFGYYFLIHRREWRNPDSAEGGILPEWLRKKKKSEAVATPKYKVNISASSGETSSASLASRGDLRAEVDRILDKINSQGFASLTAEERHILDSAKDMLSGR